jgi:hypothetical protein
MYPGVPGDEPTGGELIDEPDHAGVRQVEATPQGVHGQAGAPRELHQDGRSPSALASRVLGGGRELVGERDNDRPEEVGSPIMCVTHTHIVFYEVWVGNYA